MKTKHMKSAELILLENFLFSHNVNSDLEYKVKKEFTKNTETDDFVCVTKKLANLNIVITKQKMHDNNNNIYFDANLTVAVLEVKIFWQIKDIKESIEEFYN